MQWRWFCLSSPRILAGLISPQKPHNLNESALPTIKHNVMATTLLPVCAKPLALDLVSIVSIDQPEGQIKPSCISEIAWPSSMLFQIPTLKTFMEHGTWNIQARPRTFWAMLRLPSCTKQQKPKAKFVNRDYTHCKPQFSLQLQALENGKLAKFTFRKTWNPSQPQHHQTPPRA